MLDSISNRLEMLSLLPRGVCAEVGVLAGFFSKQILTTNPQMLYMIDCWEQQTGEYTQDPANQVDFPNLYKYIHNEFGGFPNTTIIKRYSVVAAKMFPDLFFDWVYIDANHGYDAISQDIKVWWPKIKNGGYLTGHDYVDNLDGYSFIQVKLAVDHFVTDNNHSLIITQEIDFPSWIIQK